MKSSETVPALVVGATITALGTLRSLARVGIPTYTVTLPREFAARSRWYRSLPGDAHFHPESIAEWLPDLQLPHVVLFPCSDHTVLQASKMSAGLEGRVSMCMSSTDTLELLVDKARFSALLDQAGVPGPRTWLLEDSEILSSIPDGAFEHAFLKPLDSQAFVGQLGIKAERVASRSDAIRRWTDFAEQGFDMLLQEYVPGPASNHLFIDGFVDRRGQVNALFARRRLRMHPPDFGNSSCMVSLPINEVQGAADSIRRLLSATDYRGIFSAEFKYDERDQVFRILEVNARPWWYIEFASRCGVNVCEMAYADALGENVPELDRYETGASMVYTRHDYHACREAVRRGEMSVREWALFWLRAWRPIFSWDDPWPSVVGAVRFALARIRRALGDPKAL